MFRKIVMMLFVLALAGRWIRASENPPQAGRSPDARPGHVYSSLRNDDPEIPLFTDTDRLERTGFVRAVLERNPTIEAARQAWQATLEFYPQATALDDPLISYNLMPDSLGSDDTRLGQVLRLSQRLPYPGKLRLRGELAEAQTEAARGDYRTVTLRLATIASFLFDDYYVVFRSLAINDEHLRLLEDLKRIATARYEAGTAAQQDPIQAEVEIAHISHRNLVLESEREVLRARLNALLHRRPAAPLPPPPEELPLPTPEELNSVDLQSKALSTRPEIQARKAEIRARLTAVELRKLDGRPDFEAMTSYNSMWANPRHRWAVGVGINIPLWRNRIRAGLAEARARLRQAESELKRLEDEVRADVSAARARLLEAHHVIELYRSRLLPATRDQVQAALSGFKTGRSSFLALIEAEQNLLGVELDYERALADQHRRQADLDRAVGRVPGLGVADAAAGALINPTLTGFQGERR